MLIGIFTILGILIGFYLAKYQDINRQISQAVQNIKKPKGWGEPFAIRPDEYKLEQEQLKQKEKAEIEKETNIATGQ